MLATKRYIKGFVDKYIDADLVDIDSFDYSLTYSELKEEVKEFIRPLISQQQVLEIECPDFEEQSELTDQYYRNREKKYRERKQERNTHRKSVRRIVPHIFENTVYIDSLNNFPKLRLFSNYGRRETQQRNITKKQVVPIKRRSSSNITHHQIQKLKLIKVWPRP